MRYIGRDVDEIARAGLGDEFEPLAPTHPRLALHDIDDALEMSMMMRAGLGVGVDRHRARPELLGAHAREIYRRLAVHAGRLRRVAVERIAGDHAHAVVLPGGRVGIVRQGKVSLSLS